jgi:hypothetical protein
MKIFYTVNNNSKNIKFIKDENNIVFSKWNDDISDKASLTFSKNKIDEFLNLPNSLSIESNLIYITVDENGNLNEPIFRTIETNVTKISGLDYIRYNLNKEVVAQIYIPFKNSSEDEYGVRLNIKEEDVSKLLELIPDAVEVEGTNEGFKNLNSQFLPSLKIISSFKQEDWTKIKIQLTLNGNNISKDGVRIFAKSSSGYIANREVYTDENGIAEFKVLPYGLEHGEEMKAEFGFKYYSNVVSTNVVS